MAWQLDNIVISGWRDLEVTRNENEGKNRNPRTRPDSSVFVTFLLLGYRQVFGTNLTIRTGLTD